ncbi:MAG: hypothetical protein AAGM46_26870 [Cyanobacteria bacterium J06582_2]
MSEGKCEAVGLSDHADAQVRVVSWYGATEWAESRDVLVVSGEGEVAVVA